MINNLPIYRAKKIDSDEYVYGFCFYDEVRKEMFISNDAKNLYTNRFRVDTTTLSIHFPDMLAKDSNRYLLNGEKDLRIFASLQKNGKGGDIVEYKGREYIFGYKKESFKIGLLNFRGWQLTTSDLLKVKTIGIQE